MKLGVSLPQAGAWATPENNLLVAREAEAAGFDSLWTLHRLLRAEQPQNDYPPMAGQPLPDFFRDVMDPIASLAFVAAVTERVRLGISVLVMPFYTPSLLAKQLSTLDVLSTGRLDVGLGLGWSKDEYEASGVPFERRGARGDEFIRCLKTIWTESPAAFHGEFYSVPLSVSDPRPIQRPHPPILIGGYGAAAVRRTIQFGDGFTGGNVPMDEVTPLIQRLWREAEAAGRDPRKLRVVCRGAYRVFESPQGPDRRPLFGTVAEIQDDVKRYQAAGLTELFLEGNTAPEDGRRLDTLRRLMEALAPR
ncbi:MAG: TIGR03619 family F420-dependent LLM class oxidoreductase [Chloroflexota bacterium]